jgi:hypothetical protein
MNWQTAIIGCGEVGEALGRVLSRYYPVFADPEKGLFASGKFEIIHITIPFSDSFVKSVTEYQELFQPKFTVVHSTVEPGTCRKLGAIHSPVIGQHPNLEDGIRTFPKMIAGEQASEVADYFRRAGIKVYLCKNQEDTELMKVLDTTFYAMCVEYTKDVKKQCDKFGVPFELWTLWTNNYNIGYNKLGHPEFTRPNLVPIMKKQGGHCTIPNCDFLETEFTKFIKELNTKYG